MRITYRNKNNADYWDDRWNKAGVDNVPASDDFYPLMFVKRVIQSIRGANSNCFNVKILEAGCGSGRVMHYCIDAGFQITGIDYSSTVVEMLHDEFPEMDVFHDSILGTKFRDKTFECIFAFGLYHNFNLNDCSKALSETHRIMKDNGILCCSFRADNIQNLVIDLLKSKPASGKAFHKLNLKKNELEELLDAASFELVSIEPVQNVPLLYHFSIFRHASQKSKNEQLFRSSGPKLNFVGKFLQSILVRIWPEKMCNNFTAIYRKR